MKTELQAESAQHCYIRIDDARLHCAILGDGRPVLLIPGWPQTWYAWRHIMQVLAANGFEAIAVDPVGTGSSSRPDAGYDTGAAASKLHRLMQALGHERYQVVGHDVGMWVGYALASDYPDAVSRLALTEAVIPGLASAPTIFASPAENIFLWHFMFNQVRDLPEFLIAGREKGYLEFIFDNWAHRRDRVAVDVYVQAYASPGGIRSGLSYYRAIPETIRQNVERAKRPLSMPVLALGADCATADAPMSTLGPHAADLRGGIIADCGHFIMEECSNEFCTELLPFLREA
ncbi:MULTISPECIES: alpha/beta fold hydrolase [unclassified Methylobacterium]|jgi:pimeloyl-ACP methyl ester carboxylesterase|uniref:alpha/beta fold hydrolase n=1 Tax=unclassified Methylobacterium TaxID=2615210 RepID=UPI0013556471|nr:alpha/beta hydrolase [Methylobacterium sp. 2A]MWV25986.1 alpha/beta hydrolase [Methylobacterium sp. 2A]